LHETGEVRDTDTNETQAGKETRMSSTTSPVEGLDIQAGIAQYRMEKIYNRILATYLRSVPGILAKLASPTEENLQDYIINVHGLKGSSYGVQANEVGKQAEALEHAAKAGDLAFVHANNDRLAQTTNALLGQLKTYLDAQE
jgi:HPt (histidine-containing phosphotransfer) domain-containing protein